MNMLHFHFRLSNHCDKSYNLFKSDIEALKSKALTSTKGAEMEDTQDNTRWCCFYDRNTGLGFLERSVEQKLSTAGTLFIPRLSLKLHLKVWNKDYAYTYASPDEVKEVKEIYAWDESKT
jgi:hypothetical protein